MIAPVFFSLRPGRWVKNMLVFTGVVLSGSGLRLWADAWLYAVGGFLVFCLLSGVNYLLNDLVDLAADRTHPEKKHRPLASGELSLPEAKASMILLLIAAFAGSWHLGQPFFYICLGYFMVNLAYCFGLKAVVILDLLVVAVGMALRMAAGFVILQRFSGSLKIQTELVLWAFILGLITAVVSRRHESVLVDAGEIKKKSISLYYTPEFLDKILLFCAPMFVGVYAWSCIGGALVSSGSNWFIFISFPVISYATMRLLYLTLDYEAQTGLPRKVFYDRSLQLAILVFMAIMLVRPLIT